MRARGTRFDQGYGTENYQQSGDRRAEIKLHIYDAIGAEESARRGLVDPPRAIIYRFAIQLAGPP
jgi:hypothetical protein